MNSYNIEFVVRIYFNDNYQIYSGPQKSGDICNKLKFISYSMA